MWWNGSHLQIELHTQHDTLNRDFPNTRSHTDVGNSGFSYGSNEANEVGTNVKRKASSHVISLMKVMRNKAVVVGGRYPAA